MGFFRAIKGAFRQVRSVGNVQTIGAWEFVFAEP